MTSRPTFRWILSLVLGLAASSCLVAHPMPTSRVLLDLQATGIAAELQLPLGELQLALGEQLNVTDHPETLVARSGAALRAYLLAHIHPVGPDGRPWSVAVQELAVGSTEQTDTGPYQELTAHLWLRPPTGASSRTFTLHYDVIMHQLVTHAALVSIRQDWDNGVLAEHPVEVGVIRLNPRDNSIAPLEIAPAAGSLWHGFQSMISLGMSHIAEGTDHLLFLLVLLLPAPLLVRAGRWGKFGGVRYSPV
ncbi:MAG: HupE/UreJ family protein, partial [Hymenobacter sp.]